jgi:short-subunit dehydrogenase
MVADLADKQETNQFVKFVLDTTERVDILVNNAGAFVPGQVHDEADGVLEKMIQTNLYSAYHLTRGVLKKMGKGSHIFNMCSTASFVPYVNGGSYCISKFALLGFSKVLREELKEQDIRVTALMPGATLTASWEGVEIPEERFMKAEDVADAVWSAYDLSSRTVMEEIILRPQLGDL